ncbi:MAG: pseudaminic acid synthase [Desulfotalea sp.]
MNSIRIGNYSVGTDSPPFVVAEMSGNHNQSLSRALAIVDAVAKTGAHAVKLQTYTADTMTIDCKSEGFVIDDPNSLWYGQSLYNLYKKAHTPWEWHKPIIDRCSEHGLLCFSTPFDESSVEFLEDLDMPAYKIASFEMTDIPLIRKVASTGKPMIISTGMASVDEIEETLSAAQKAGCNEIILLKCTSTYPSSPADSNLRTIPDMQRRFGVQVGLSDHTLGIGTSLVAIGYGATFIEKHFTLDRSAGGVDDAFSIEPDEMKSLVVESNRAWLSLGEIRYTPSKQEEASLNYRRSLYVVQDIKAGEHITEQNVRSIRPGFGLHPRHLNDIYGKPVKKDTKKGSPLEWNLISF